MNNRDFLIGDPVVIRQTRGDHEQRGRVVGRTFGKSSYDVELSDGERINNVTMIRADRTQEPA